MQDYTPLGSTATTTVKDGILNHEKNINALRSTYSGTAFPTENLVAGMKCYRTDLGKTYTYNGKTWVDSVSTSSLTVSGETSVPTPATANKSNTIANTEFVHGVVSELVNGAPDALNTLQELATALGNDPNFSTTVLNQIGEKESKTDAQIEHKKLQDAIPTKVSQLLNDSGYQKTTEIPVASQMQDGYMSKGDKAKLDGIAEGATNVTDYVQSVTELNGKVTVTKGSGESTTFNAGLNIFARNKAYAVGDIAYSPNLPSYLYLECTKAGTTGTTEPDFSDVNSGVVIIDGDAEFAIMTVGSAEKCVALEKALNDFIASRTLKAGGTVSIGDTIAVGYVTAGGTSFRCIIPLNIISSAILDGTLTGSCTMRQNGKYLITSDYFNFNKYFTYDRCMFNPCGFLDIWLYRKASDSNVNNNDVLVIQFQDLVFHANEN